MPLWKVAHSGTDTGSSLHPMDFILSNVPNLLSAPLPFVLISTNRKKKERHLAVTVALP